MRLPPNGYASRPKHPLNTSVHFFFFNEFTACYLVDTDLNLSIEPFTMRQHMGNGFLHQLVGSAACSDRKSGKLQFLISR